MANYTFPTHVKGDTFEAIVFQVKVNDVLEAIDSVEMKVRNSADTVVATYTTVDSDGLTLLTTGKYKFNEQIIDIMAGVHKYDMEIALTSRKTKTYVDGNWTITQDVTYE